MNLIWKFAIGDSPQNCTFEFPSLTNNKMMDEESGEVGARLVADGVYLFTSVTMVSMVTLMTMVGGFLVTMVTIVMCSLNVYSG
jgi:hypothetical protein